MMQYENLNDILQSKLGKDKNLIQTFREIINQNFELTS